MKKSRILSALIKRPLLGVALIILLLSVTYVNLYNYPTIAIEESSYITIEGIVGEYTRDGDGSIKSFLLKNCYGENRVGIAKGLNVLCYVNRNSLTEFPPIGSNIEVCGKVSFFQKATNPGQFDLAGYYSGKHILFALKDISIKTVEPPLCLIMDKINKLRLFFSGQVRKNCQLEYGTINTILWADKSNLPPERKSLYQEVGLAHFLVISGLHIQALGSGLYISLRRLNIPRRPAAFAGILTILCYGIFVGFQISLLRAVTMFFVRLLADILNKPYDMLSAMSLAMIITLIADPFYCLDTGFVYSYMSVLALSLYMEIIRKSRPHPPISLVMWLFLLPLTLFFSFRVSFLGIVLNLLLGLFTLPLMVISFLCFLFSLHNFTLLASICDFSFALIIKSMDKVCQFCQKFPFLSVSGKPHICRIFLYYFLLFSFIIYFQKKVSPFLEYVFYIFLVLLIAANLKTKPLFTMLDVGQGDCMVLSYLPGRCIIVDAGSSTCSDLSKYILLPFLRQAGIGTVDNIYLTHSDKDHINAVEDLLLQSSDLGIDILKITVSHYAYREMDKNLEGIVSLAKKLGIPLEMTSSGQKKVYGGCLDKRLEVSCLWPGKGESAKDSNSNSLVLLASYDGFDIMLTGDSTSETENMILNETGNVLKMCDDSRLEVLKVAHHGSKYSSSPEFLKLLKPDYAIVSVGLHNSYNHPHKETLARLKEVGARVYRTDYDGAISFYLK